MAMKNAYADISAVPGNSSSGPIDC